MANALERIHAERGVSIEVECPDEAGFRGEAQDLEEVVGNLLDNACKWATELVRLTVVAQGIERRNRPYLLIAVEDDGPGLREEARKTVLKRGARLDETKPGSGLGLSIVTEIAELYGGELKLDASALGGLKASLYIPASATAA